MLDEPSDFIGNILAKLINRQLESSSDLEKFKKWKMSVILETDYYPVSIVFNDGIRIEAKVVENPTLTFRTKFNTIISIAKNETSILSALLRGNIKVKGLISHPRAAFRFYRLMNSILK